MTFFVFVLFVFFPLVSFFLGIKKKDLRKMHVYSYKKEQRRFKRIRGPPGSPSATTDNTSLEFLGSSGWVVRPLSQPTSLSSPLLPDGRGLPQPDSQDHFPPSIDVVNPNFFSNDNLDQPWWVEGTLWNLNSTLVASDLEPGISRGYDPTSEETM